MIIEQEYCIDDRIKVMVEKIRAYVEKYHMLEQSDIVVAGISGGADSVCLLFVCRRSFCERVDRTIQNPLYNLLL